MCEICLRVRVQILQIPGLVSLKRHPSVVFVGIDTLDDIRNNSYIELFVSGGCIVSDELVLSPDFITHGMPEICIQRNQRLVFKPL